MTCYSAKYIGDKLASFEQEREYLLGKLVHKITRKMRRYYPDYHVYGKGYSINKGEDAFNYFNGKYDVEWWFHEDTDNNQFSIELKLVDVTDHPEDPELDKLIEEALSNINTNSVDVNKLTKDDILKLFE